MTNIRQATREDISRIAEILIFTKRMNYRSIFKNDKVSFGEMQVVPLANEFYENEKLLNGYYVYDDEFVKGLVHIDGKRIVELYVDSFFENCGIGSKLISFAKDKGANFLYVIEKNENAQRFYKRNGFKLTTERILEEGTTEYIVKMKL